MLLFKFKCVDYDWRENEIKFSDGYVRADRIEGLQKSDAIPPKEGEILTDLCMVGRDSVITVAGDPDHIAQLLVHWNGRCAVVKYDPTAPVQAFECGLGKLAC